MRLPRAGLAGLAAALVVVLAVIVLRATGSTPGCRPDARLVPSCGVVWGVATDPNTNAGLSKAEARLGQRFPLVYRFHDLDDPLPTPDERALVRSGRLLHITIDARLFEHPGQLVTWRAIADGDFDAALRRQAEGVAALHAPLWLTFDHEPDQPARTARGSPADYVAAWRHVHDLFTRAGAGNAVWTWVVTGDPPAFGKLAALWPGNRYVDWIGWEAYNSAGCLRGAVQPGAYRSFAQAALPFLAWLRTTGRAAGIGQGKPLMISEAGSVEYADAPAKAAGWYRGIGAVLSAHPAIKAVTLWDRPGAGQCRYRFDTHANVAAAIAAARLAGGPFAAP